MTETKRCSGYKGRWGCEDEYPDHIVPIDQFYRDKNHLSGLAYNCKRCNTIMCRANMPRRNGIISTATKLVGGRKILRAMPKEKRLTIMHKLQAEAKAIRVEEIVDTTPRHKSEFGQSTPMTKRETTVVEGEQVPEGWVYVVYNPDVPSVLKIGKTFPDGIPSIMSSARRFGRAELADKFWFSEAYKAEQAIHTVLSDCNLRALGYSDCGVELFKCNLNDVRGAVENAKH